MTDDDSICCRYSAPNDPASVVPGIAHASRLWPRVIQGLPEKVPGVAGGIIAQVPELLVTETLIKAASLEAVRIEPSGPASPATCCVLHHGQHLPPSSLPSKGV